MSQTDMENDRFTIPGMGTFTSAELDAMPEGVRRIAADALRSQKRRTCTNCGESYRESDHVFEDRDDALCPSCAVGG